MFSKTQGNSWKFQLNPNLNTVGRKFSKIQEHSWSFLRSTNQTPKNSLIDCLNSFRKIISSYLLERISSSYLYKLIKIYWLVGIIGYIALSYYMMFYMLESIDIKMNDSKTYKSKQKQGIYFQKMKKFIANSLESMCNSIENTINKLKVK